MNTTTQRRNMKFLSALWILITLYFVFLLSNHHRIRSALIPIKYVRDYRLIYSKPKRELEKPNSSSLERAKKLIYYIYLLKSRKKFRVYLTEDPKKLLEIYKYGSYYGSCYNNAIIFYYLSKDFGLNSRLVDLQSRDGLGGSGHTVNEFFDEENKKWVLLDPSEGIIFFDSSNKPLSAYELKGYFLRTTEKDFFHLVSLWTLKNVNLNYIYRFYKRDIASVFFIIDSSQNYNLSRKVGYTIQNLDCRYCVQFGRFINRFFSPPVLLKLDENSSIEDFFITKIYFITFRVLFPIWLGLLIFLIFHFGCFIRKFDKLVQNDFEKLTMKAPSKRGHIILL